MRTQPSIASTIGLRRIFAPVLLIDHRKDVIPVQTFVQGDIREKAMAIHVLISKRSGSTHSAVVRAATGPLNSVGVKGMRRE